MHELAITESVIEAISDRFGSARIVRVQLEIGKLSGVMLDALRFCFGLSAEGTALANATFGDRRDARPRDVLLAEPLPLRTLTTQSRCANAAAPIWNFSPAANSKSGKSKWLRRWPDMCTTCGCSDDANPRLIDLDHEYQPTRTLIRTNTVTMTIPTMRCARRFSTSARRPSS